MDKQAESVPHPIRMELWQSISSCFKEEWRNSFSELPGTFKAQIELKWGQGYFFITSLVHN